MRRRKRYGPREFESEKPGPDRGSRLGQDQEELPGVFLQHAFVPDAGMARRMGKFNHGRFSARDPAPGLQLRGQDCDYKDF